MKSYAPSFYQMDQDDLKTAAAALEEDDCRTATGPPAAKMPVYSAYYDDGMMPPAYNTIVEAIPEEYILSHPEIFFGGATTRSDSIETAHEPSPPAPYVQSFYLGGFNYDVDHSTDLAAS